MLVSDWVRVVQVVRCNSRLRCKDYLGWGLEGDRVKGKVLECSKEIRAHLV